MADNYTIKNSDGVVLSIAADEVSAGVFSPRVTPLHNGTDVSAANPLPVNATVSGNVTVQDGGNSLTVDGLVAATQSGTWNLANITGSITLPTGAATSANQTTIIGHIDGIEGLLTGISANTPALVGGKVPVDVGSITISNLTLGNVTIDNKANNPVPISDAGGSLTVDGSVGVTGNVTVQDGGNSLTVDGAVSITGALPTGSNTIGAVTISGTPSVTATISGTPSVAISGALPTGANTIGAVTISGTPNVTLTGTSNVSVTSLPALPTGSNVIGSVNVNGTPNVSITGTPNVAVTSLPALPTGSNTIGAVTISGTPSVTVSGALPTGANVIGSVNVNGTPSVSISGTPAVSISGALPTGSNTIGAVTISGTPSVSVSGALPTGANTIGAVSITGALPTGANTIGAVTISGTPSVNATISGTPSVSISGTPNVSITSAIPTGSNTIGNVGITDVTPGTGATNLGKAEDAAHTSGDVGVMTLAVRKDVAGSFAATDGDYVPLQVDADGSLRVNVTAGGSSGGGGTQYDEDTAHEAGEKLTMAGVVRKDTAASLVGADNDRTSLIVDNAGKLWVNTGNVTIDSASPVNVVGTGTVVSANFTRPNDTTAYAVGDVVANSTTAAGLLEFPNFARVNGGTGYIVYTRVTTNQKSNPSAYRVHLYNDSNITAVNDNSPLIETYADTTKKIGTFVIGPMTTPANTTGSDISQAEDSNLRLFFKAGASTRSIWARVETLTANTPSANQQFTIILGGDLN